MYWVKYGGYKCVVWKQHPSTIRGYIRYPVIVKPVESEERYYLAFEYEEGNLGEPLSGVIESESAARAAYLIMFPREGDGYSY